MVLFTRFDEIAERVDIFASRKFKCFTVTGIISSRDVHVHTRMRTGEDMLVGDTWTD